MTVREKMGKAEKRQIRIWGAIGGALLLLIGLFSEIPGKIYFIGAGIIWATLASIAPAMVRSAYRGWMLVTGAIGTFITKIILCIVFYACLTPIGTAMRLFGKDVLHREFKKDISSYWKKKEKATKNVKQYEKQF